MPKDEWITVHPNGKENKGRPLFVEEGEKEEAKKKKLAKTEKKTRNEQIQKKIEVEKDKRIKLAIQQTNFSDKQKQELTHELNRLHNYEVKTGNAAGILNYNLDILEQMKGRTPDEVIAEIKRHNDYKRDFYGLDDWRTTENGVLFNPKSEKCDKMQAQDKKEIDHNDFWYIKDNPLSKVGVFPYLGRQISPELEPDKIYQVLRPEEELNSQETLDSFKLVPIVDDHTMLGTKPGMLPAEEKGVHGVIGDDVYYKDGIIYGDLKIFSESLKEEIENGKKELSMGYFCDYEIKDGEFNGEPYQAIQRNLKINHVALVDEGRMGADVRVMDRQITFDSIKEIKDMTKMQKQSLGKSALDEDIEAITKDECKTQDGDVDKRALIDEIGGMLKDKVDEELWRTIVGKLEQLSYNDSETGANDEETDVEEEKKTTDEEIIEEPAAITEEPKEDEEPAAEVTVSNGEAEVTVSLDSMIKEIGQRDALVEAVRPLIGDNSKYKMMSTKEVAKYACDKLDLKVSNGQEVSVLRGYIAATKKNQNKVNYSLDSAVSFAPKKDAALEAYMKGGN